MCAEVAWKSLVKCRLISSMGTTWASPPAAPALHAEHGTQRRLPDADYGLLAQAAHGLSHAYGDGGFPFSRRRGVDAGHQNQSPGRLPLGDGLCRDLGLVPPVRQELIWTEAQLGGHFADGTELGCLGDLDVSWDLGHLRDGSSPGFNLGPNTRAAFAPVYSSISCNDRPRTSARRAAVLSTNAGSFRRPRWGTGAR